MARMGLFEPDPDATDLERTAALALRLASRCAAPYSSRFSRRDFTQPQLLACLVVKASRGLTYRAAAELLASGPGLRAALGLARAPHFTTLESTANAPGAAAAVAAMTRELMLELGGGGRPAVEAVALDSTYLQATGASAHFVARRRREPAFVKLSVAVVCGAMLPCAAVATWGRSGDLAEGPGVVRAAAAAVDARALYADAGYDGERLHRLCREELGIESWVPPVPRAPDGSVRTRWRSMMARLPRGYRRRWNVEAFFSALKRTTGPSLRARGRGSALAEAVLRVLAYGVRR